MWDLLMIFSALTAFKLTLSVFESTQFGDSAWSEDTLAKYSKANQLHIRVLHLYFFSRIFPAGGESKYSCIIKARGKWSSPYLKLNKAVLQRVFESVTITWFELVLCTDFHQGCRGVRYIQLQSTAEENRTAWSVYSAWCAQNPYSCNRCFLNWIIKKNILLN